MEGFRNVRIWDGSGSQPIEADAIAIADGQIVELGELSPEMAARARDMGGCTLIPGLIDAHVHMVLDPDVHQVMEQDHVDSGARQAAMVARAGAMVRAGITTARDLGGGQWGELALRDQIAAGAVAGPRLLCAGQPITSVGGHCHFWGGEAANAREALEVLDRQAAHQVDLIKVMATGGSLTPKSRPVDAQFDRATLEAIVAAATEAGYHVAAHCHGTAGIRNAAEAGVRTIEHCSWVGNAGWGTDWDEEVARTIVDRGIWVSPTISAGWTRHIGRDQGLAVHVRNNLIRLRELGGRLIASTDAGIPNVPHHDLPRALPILAHFAGMGPIDTLRSATSDGAEGIGLGGRTGRIAVNYAADLLFVDGDPLTDLGALEAPVCVVAAGRVYDDPHA